MLKWEKKNKKKDKNEEKETLPERGDLEAIGLSPSKSSSNVSIHNESGTYISHASVAEIKKNYGTIHEYLKQRHGPGKYTITVRGKGGDDTQHISIAGEESSFPGPENPSPGMMDNNQFMGIYLATQVENAKLKTEIDAMKNTSQQSMLGQIVPNVIDFIKTMMQSRPDTDLASVMTAATDCLKTLSEIKTPGEKSDDVGGLMGGIAQLVQGFQQQRQAQPTPNPVYIQAPAPYFPPPVIAQSPPILTPPQAGGYIVHGGMPTVPNPTNPSSAPPDNSSTDVFFENLLGMAEQRQSPKVVADYLVQSIQKISPQEIQKLDPQMQMLMGQLQVNPVGAFDAICQFEPSLAADGKYTAEIRAELQKIEQG